MSTSEDNTAVSLESGVLDQLNTKEAKDLHQLTDELSSCGVGKIVNLPQIIVVGEQSAGKSSVLEAISHIRFPVDSGKCTRFATELVLRHAKETRVDISVRFDDRSKTPKAFQRKGFRDEDLPDIIKEAKEYMGLSEIRKEYSKDVLRLEVNGPNMFPLTLVDLPGLYSNRTEDQSSQGKDMVDQIIESYMKQTNSIILVVIAATREIPHQVALEKVRKHDPKLERTIGVITKPDLIKAGFVEERSHIRLAKNRESTLKFDLGWHVLRNRAEDEDSLETRDNKETEFFQTSAWAELPQEDRGIASLRKRLSRVLFTHVRNNLPNVVGDIEEKLRERKEELARLGPERAKREERRSFLLEIAQKFHSLAECGIDGRYNDSFFGTLDDTEHKFRAQLRNFNRAFDYVLAQKGSKLAITSPDDTEKTEPEVPEHLKAILETSPYDCPEPRSILLEDLHTRLEKQAASNQGREFAGSPNRDLVIQLFQDQASPWKDIASSHINHVTIVAKAFVDQVFRHVVGQPEVNRTTEAILRNYVDTFFEEKQERLSEKLLELWRPYERGYAMPQDAEFHQMVRRRTMDRLATWVEATVDEDPEGLGTATRQWLTGDLFTKAVSALEGPSQGEFGTGKVIDMMQAYYEMSRRTFADNIINLAIESCLVADLPDILTPTKVDRMSDEQLEELAAESDDAKSRREHLKEEEKTLQEGLEKCRKYKPRGMTVVPSGKSSSSAAPEVTSNSTGFGAPAANGTSSSGGLFGSSLARESRSIHEAAQQPKPSGGLFGSRNGSPASAFGSRANGTPSPRNPLSAPSEDS